MSQNLTISVLKLIAASLFTIIFLSQLTNANEAPSIEQKVLEKKVIRIKHKYNDEVSARTCMDYFIKGEGYLPKDALETCADIITLHTGGEEANRECRKLAYSLNKPEDKEEFEENERIKDGVASKCIMYHKDLSTCFKNAVAMDKKWAKDIYLNECYFLAIQSSSKAETFFELLNNTNKTYCEQFAKNLKFNEHEMLNEYLPSDLCSGNQIYEEMYPHDEKMKKENWKKLVKKYENSQDGLNPFKVFKKFIQ